LQPAQIILIGFALAVAGGGVVMLAKGAGRESSGTPRPYIPLGVAGVGLVVAYQAITSYARLSPADIALLFLFVFALALFMGLRFFVVDRYDLSQMEQPGSESTEAGAENASQAEDDTTRGDEERTA
jgi:hypothetical protein